MNEPSPWRRRCAMCREVFDGFRATWTDTCAECEPKIQAMRAAATNRYRQGVEDE